jgi:hypothetical protein
MAQFIRTPVNIQDAMSTDLHQVSQIVYHDQRIIEIDWQPSTNSIIILDNGVWFYLYSPDIHNMTILNVIQGLGYGDEQIIVTWADNNSEELVLNSYVNEAPINQIAIYGINQQIPEHQEPFPVIEQNNEDTQTIHSYESLYDSDSDNDSYDYLQF